MSIHGHSRYCFILLTVIKINTTHVGGLTKSLRKCINETSLWQIYRWILLISIRSNKQCDRAGSQNLKFELSKLTESRIQKQTK